MNESIKKVPTHFTYLIRTKTVGGGSSLLWLRWWELWYSQRRLSEDFSLRYPCEKIKIPSGLRKYICFWWCSGYFRSTGHTLCYNKVVKNFSIFLGIFQVQCFPISLHCIYLTLSVQDFWIINFIIGYIYVISIKNLEIIISEKEQYFGCFIKANIQTISEKYLSLCRETRLREEKNKRS